MFRKSAIALLTASLALTACQSDNRGTDQTVGTLGGAAGSRSQSGNGSDKLATTGPGVILGGWAGNEIGASMDDADRIKIRQAEARAYTAPVGQQVTWNNPNDGTAGTIIPVRDGYAANGAYCREFQQTITIGGQQRQGYGKACQQPDGSWKEEKKGAGGIM